MQAALALTPERLKEFRAERRWSRSQAALETGTSRNSWARWEADDGEPPDWLGYVLAAKAFGLPPLR